MRIPEYDELGFIVDSKAGWSPPRGNPCWDEYHHLIDEDEGAWKINGEEEEDDDATEPTCLPPKRVSVMRTPYAEARAQRSTKMSKRRLRRAVDNVFTRPPATREAVQKLYTARPTTEPAHVYRSQRSRDAGPLVYHLRPPVVPQRAQWGTSPRTRLGQDCHISGAQTHYSAGYSASQPSARQPVTAPHRRGVSLAGRPQAAAALLSSPRPPLPLVGVSPCPSSLSARLPHHTSRQPTPRLPTPQHTPRSPQAPRPSAAGQLPPAEWDCFVSKLYAAEAPPEAALGLEPSRPSTQGSAGSWQPDWRKHRLPSHLREPSLSRMSRASWECSSRPPVRLVTPSVLRPPVETPPLEISDQQVANLLFDPLPKDEAVLPAARPVSGGAKQALRSLFEVGMEDDEAGGPGYICPDTLEELLHANQALRERLNLLGEEWSFWWQRGFSAWVAGHGGRHVDPDRLEFPAVLGILDATHAAYQAHRDTLVHNAQNSATESSTAEGHSSKEYNEVWSDEEDEEYGELGELDEEEHGTLVLRIRSEVAALVTSRGSKARTRQIRHELFEEMRHRKMRLKQEHAERVLMEHEKQQAEETVREQVRATVAAEEQDRLTVERRQLEEMAKERKLEWDKLEQARELSLEVLQRATIEQELEVREAQRAKLVAVRAAQEQEQARRVAQQVEAEREEQERLMVEQVAREQVARKQAEQEQRVEEERLMKRLGEERCEYSATKIQALARGRQARKQAGEKAETTVLDWPVAKLVAAAALGNKHAEKAFWHHFYEAQHPEDPAVARRG